VDFSARIDLSHVVFVVGLADQRFSRIRDSFHFALAGFNVDALLAENFY
jgi:hypothetical protein